MVFNYLCSKLILDYMKKFQTILDWIKKHLNSILIITLAATIIGNFAYKWINDAIKNHKFYSKPYITLDANYTQVFYLSKEVPSLEYSVNESEWEELKTKAIVFGGNHGKLLLRGKNKCGTNGATIKFGTDAEVICTGNINTLVNYKDYKNTTKYKTSFKQLFQNCQQLIVAPELTPKFLADSCYYGMFAGCTSLKIAPELPADSLSTNCYSYMFYKCSSLEKVPELSAMTLKDSCYFSMFEKCISIKEIPTIKAKNLASHSCSNMFKGCTSLLYVSVLPAENMAEYCYSYMFSECSSLIISPYLPSEKLAKGCYSHMFSNCTKLFATSPLPAKNLEEGCYSHMFYGCSSLERAPILPAENITTNTYSSMFEKCPSLSEITIAGVEFPENYIIGVYLFGISSPSKVGKLFKNKQAKWDHDIYPFKNWRIEFIELEEIENEMKHKKWLHKELIDILYKKKDADFLNAN